MELGDKSKVSAILTDYITESTQNIKNNPSVKTDSKQELA
jgi:hypothetical protein